jgi:hypothetical protein
MQVTCALEAHVLNVTRERDRRVLLSDSAQRHGLQLKCVHFLKYVRLLRGLHRTSVLSKYPFVENLQNEILEQP